MNKENIPVITDREELYDKCENMAVTLINQIIYGIPEVANKRFKRDVAEAMYNTAQESINVLKLQIRVLENQLSREYYTNTPN